jgi:hypothetical protein
MSIVNLNGKYIKITGVDKTLISEAHSRYPADLENSSDVVDKLSFEFVDEVLEDHYYLTTNEHSQLGFISSTGRNIVMYCYPVEYMLYEKLGKLVIANVSQLIDTSKIAL